MRDQSMRIQSHLYSSRKPAKAACAVKGVHSGHRATTVDMAQVGMQIGHVHTRTHKPFCDLGLACNDTHVFGRLQQPDFADCQCALAKSSQCSDMGLLGML